MSVNHAAFKVNLTNFISTHCKELAIFILMKLLDSSNVVIMLSQMNITLYFAVGIFD